VPLRTLLRLWKTGWSVAREPRHLTRSTMQRAWHMKFSLRGSVIRLAGGAGEVEDLAPELEVSGCALSCYRAPFVLIESTFRSD
jgi:hypothetical protein